MAGFAAARQGDGTTHDRFVNCGTIAPMPSPNGKGPVLIENLPAAYVSCPVVCLGVTMGGLAHPPSPVPTPIANGSPTVFIYGMAAARWLPSGDAAGCSTLLGIPGLISTRTVLIGDAPPFGMMTRGEAIAAAVKQLQQDWSNLSPEDREKRLQKISDDQFNAIGVPPPKVKRDSVGGFGVWDPSDWTFKVNGTLVSKAGELSDADAKELAATLAHEGRHCEQDYDAARYAASKGKTQDDLQKLGYPEAVAHAATTDTSPFGPGPAGLGQRTYDEKYGDGQANHQKTERDMEKAAANDEKVRGNKASDADDRAKSGKARKEAFDRYHDTLSGENDAFQTEEDLKRQWT